MELWWKQIRGSFSEAESLLGHCPFLLIFSLSENALTLQNPWAGVLGITKSILRDIEKWHSVGVVVLVPLKRGFCILGENGQDGWLQV